MYKLLLVAFMVLPYLNVWGGNGDIAFAERTFQLYERVSSKDMTPIKTAVRFEITLKCTERAMEWKAFKEVLQPEPLWIKGLNKSSVKTFKAYEAHPFNAFADDEIYSQTELPEIMNAAIRNMHKKACIFDMETVNQYYPDKINSHNKSCTTDATAYIRCYWFYDTNPDFTQKHRHKNLSLNKKNIPTECDHLLQKALTMHNIYGINLYSTPYIKGRYSLNP